MRYAFRLWKFIFFRNYQDYLTHRELLLRIDKEVFYEFLNGNYQDLKIFESISEE